MDDILTKLREAGLTLKCGCGVGYEFSTLRPRGDYVSGAGATTSGSLSFNERPGLCPDNVVAKTIRATHTH